MGGGVVCRTHTAPTRGRFRIPVRGKDLSEDGAAISITPEDTDLALEDAFGKLDRGWLTLLTDTEYRAAVAGATDHKACATSDHGEVAVASECTVPPLHGLGEASAPAAPELTKQGASHVMLLSLGDGFDERARAAYERLYASDRAVCAA